MTAFDAAVRAIERAGYHNHRRESHSDALSTAFFNDLLEHCESLRHDVESGIVKMWLNVRSPGDRLRKIDLLIGEPHHDGRPDIGKVRIALENKSIITAHRNRTNRFDDLTKILGAIHSARPQAIILGTVLIGLAERVLNVPDRVHPPYRVNVELEVEFESDIRPRLSSGDPTLWNDFPHAISRNRSTDPKRTLDLLKTMPLRRPGHTHVRGFDVLIGAPVYIDNVNPPHVPRPNPLGVDVDAEYAAMLDQVCRGYNARWWM